MPSLSSELRNKLERVVIEARDAAEVGARAALESLAVHHHEPYPHMKPRERELRNHLRARARQLGDRQDGSGRLAVGHLVGECAYEHWHRMLFARFLAENNLLIEPDENMAISLAEAEELAKEQGLDVWAYASRCAQVMLPQIFRPDDPLLQVSFATEHRIKLERLLASLPAAVFTASDALGWVYQFWQSKKKDEVNRSEVKIGADEISAVTQLFTEPYMVEFLLHNTLGAWWAGKVAAASSRWSSLATEAEGRQACALPGLTWDYLRFIEPVPVGFYRKDDPVEKTAANLPHWRQDGVTYFVTFRTADSLPQERLQQWLAEKEQWWAAHPEPRDDDTMREFYRRFPERFEHWLDQGYGACHLRQPAVRQIVEDALKHFNGQRYALDEFTVAGNHVHVLVTPRDGHELSDILHSWKSFTANQINKRLARTGAFWQKESFDHIVRSEVQLERIRAYIRNHNVEAASSRLETEDKRQDASTHNVEDKRQDASTHNVEDKRQDASTHNVEDKRQDAASTLRPAAGTFQGWPKTAAELKVLDPCCGSGHFLVAALHHLAPIRMAEEGLSEVDAVDAVLRDNLHGLEIDERCCQIAAFALALAAWTYPGAGGYRSLPELRIACTGIGPQCSAEQWLKLADTSGMPMPRGGREPIKNGLLNLHHLFSQAPMLGSLIDPTELPRDLIAADFETIQPYLTAIHEAEKAGDETRERAIAAAGMVKATDVLAGDYTMVITNVPYLEQRKQSAELRAFCQETYAQAKGDIASVFVDRSFGFLVPGGTAALVTPQNWLYLTTYGKLRRRLLKTKQWHAVAKLGPGAFGTITGHVVQPVLIILNETPPAVSGSPFSLDASGCSTPDAKSEAIRCQEPLFDTQESILANPDARVVFGFESSTQTLGDHALCLAGIMNGDSPKFLRVFWEMPSKGDLWAYQQTTVESTRFFGGMTNLILFDEAEGHLREDADVRRAKLHNSDERGNQVWGRRGVAITQMSNCPVAFYDGNKYDSNIAVVSPRDDKLLWPIWAYCNSPEFISAVKELEPKMNVTNATFAKLPFDLAHWQKVAAEKYPNGLPEPESDDPTQWLFHGYPGGTVAEASSLYPEYHSQGSSSVAEASSLYPEYHSQGSSSVAEASRLRSKNQVSATVGHFDPDEPIANLAGDLPHWGQEGVTYFVTFRCADALPREKLDQWRREIAEWRASHTEPHDAHTRRESYERFPARLQKWLDAGHGSCPLRDAENREIVESAIMHFHGQRYEVLESVVAANHVHVLVTPLGGWELSKILHSWKSFTANRINARLGRTGALWQKESFDHIVRNAESLEKFRQYIRGHDRAGKGREESDAANVAAANVAAAASRRLAQRQDAAATLQVAVARLLGYRWPAESDLQMRLSKRARDLVKRCEELTAFADTDGIVCIPSVRGEEPAADRLLRLLEACGSGILPLQSAAGSRSHLDLDDWLRNGFFEEHCKLFHDRPFIWHIWDGRKRDGFHALVNYHRLCGSGILPLASDSAAGSRSHPGSHPGRRLLENLTYAYLGEWITRQKDGVKRGEGGADDRLAAAIELQKRLEAILAGEPPFDIFVRWKKLSEQPIGWEPDINDGVRMNIRPFLASDLPGGKKGAGILRCKPNVKWTKDRGKEPERPKDEYPWFWSWDEKTEDFLGGKKFDGNRWNDCHYTNKAKQSARDAAGKGKP